MTAVCPFIDVSLLTRKRDEAVLSAMESRCGWHTVVNPWDLLWVLGLSRKPGLGHRLATARTQTDKTRYARLDDI